MTVISIPPCAIVDSTVYAGLYLEDAAAPSAVPLVSVHAEVRIVDTVCQTTLTQTYANLEPVTVQAKYVFPLYEKAAVTSFSAEIDGRIVEGVAKEKLQAKAEYSAAVARGDGAYLLEQERPDIFMCSVGNLPPSKLVTVRIKYCHELSLQDKTLRLLLPAHIAPRYSPAHDYEGRLSPVLNSITYASKFGQTVYQPITTPGPVLYLPAWLHDPRHPFARFRRPRFTPAVLVPVQQPATTRYVPFTLPAQQPPRFSVQVVVEASSDITAVSSPSHPADLLLAKSSPTCLEATLVSPSVRLEKDFVLNLTTSNFAQPRVLWEAYGQDSEEARKMGGYGGCAMLTMVPKFATQSVPSECIFVLDRSGSMSGSRIEQTKRALHLFLRSLPEGSFFNFVSFGNSYTCWKKSSVKYSEATFKEASIFVDGLQANMGGTEIMKPLEHILAPPSMWSGMARPPKGYSRQVFVLTDGQVSNEPEVVDRVKQWCANHSSRVFSLGIGSGVSTFLVEGIARGGHGTARFVQDNEDLRPVVVSLMQQAVAPALTDLKLEWHCPNEKTLSASPATTVTEVPVLPVPSAPPAGPRSFFDAQAVAAFEETAAKPAAPAVTLKAAVPAGVHQAPYVAPTIHSGSHFVAYAFFASNNKPDYVTLRANSTDGPLELRLPLTDANRRGPALPWEGEETATINQKPDGLLHRLAARAMLRDLEEGTSYLHSPAHGGAPHPSEVSAEGVRLGTSFGLASKWTSFVAIERRANGVSSELRDLFAIGQPTVERNVPQFGCNAMPQALHLQSMQLMSMPTADVRCFKKSASRSRGSGLSAIGSTVASLFSSPAPAAMCFASSASAAPQREAIRRIAAPSRAAPSAPVRRAECDAMFLERRAESTLSESAMDVCCEDEDECEDAFGDASCQAASAALPPPPACAAPQQQLQQRSSGRSVDVVGEVTMEQDFDGSFKPSDKLCGLLGVSRAALAAIAKAQGVSETAVCSAAVAVLLRERYASRQSLWCMLLEKTDRFLEKELKADANRVAALLAAVRAVVAP